MSTKHIIPHPNVPTTDIGVGKLKEVTVLFNENFNSLDGTAKTAREDIDSLKEGKADREHNHDDAYAPKGHTHFLTEVTSLEEILNQKAAAEHEHPQYLTAIPPHTHQESEIGTLVATLSEKANTNHTHVMSDVAGLESRLNETATQAQLNNLAGSISGVLSNCLTTDDVKNGMTGERDVSAASHKHDGVYAGKEEFDTFKENVTETFKVDEQLIEIAQQTANEAKTAAATAQSTANNAKSTADTAATNVGLLTEAVEELADEVEKNKFPGFGGDGTATTASHSDHTHDDYLKNPQTASTVDRIWGVSAGSTNSELKDAIGSDMVLIDTETTLGDLVEGLEVSQGLDFDPSTGDVDVRVKDGGGILLSDDGIEVDVSEGGGLETDATTGALKVKLLDKGGLIVETGATDTGAISIGTKEDSSIIKDSTDGKLKLNDSQPTGTGTDKTIECNMPGDTGWLYTTSQFISRLGADLRKTDSWTRGATDSQGKRIGCQFRICSRSYDMGGGDKLNFFRTITFDADGRLKSVTGEEGAMLMESI